MQLSNVGLLSTFALALATAWLAISRFRVKPDTSWPLVYYLAIVIYSHSFQYILNPYILYVAVVCALLLRFEFMNQRLIGIVRLVEVAALAHIAWKLSVLLIQYR